MHLDVGAEAHHQLLRCTLLGDGDFSIHGLHLPGDGVQLGGQLFGVVVGVSSCAACEVCMGRCLPRERDSDTRRYGLKRQHKKFGKHLGIQKCGTLSAGRLGYRFPIRHPQERRPQLA